MNFSLLVFFLVFSLVSAITPEEIQKIHEKCQSDTATHVDDDVIDKVRRGEKITHPNWPKYILCMNVASGFQHANGDINLNQIRTNLEKTLDDKAKVNEIISKCGTRSSTNAEEAAVALFDCLHSFNI